MGQLLPPNYPTPGMTSEVLYNVSQQALESDPVQSQALYLQLCDRNWANYRNSWSFGFSMGTWGL